MLYEENGAIYIDDSYPSDVFAEERRAARERRAEMERRYDELVELVELTEQAAMDELAAFGSYDAVPNCVEAFGVHEAIETQVAGIYGMSDRAFAEPNWWD